MVFIDALLSLLNIETLLILALLVAMGSAVSWLISSQVSIRFVADITFYAALMISFWFLATELANMTSLQAFGMSLPPIIGLPLMASGLKLYAVLHDYYQKHHPVDHHNDVHQ
ncbi:hypothetical protein [Salinibius halmophilus]|uniref:hypothetical protein n=1 Tax=Salinibius halmophilus TaxID=1853216 RepID=UPI000E660BAF|nr:hypothetical protein [Salinibius halmophilus]